MWRKLVLERDGFACRKCGATDDLHIHHVKPMAFFPELLRVVSNAITLCAGCHRKIVKLRGPVREPMSQRVIPGERWRDVVGYEGNYSVSNFGRVRRNTDGTGNCKAGRIRQTTANRDGYTLVTIYLRGVKKTKAVHKLVAVAFLGPCPKGSQANHKDGSKQNNQARNLKYVTISENHKHAYRTGLQATRRGTSSGNVRLSERDVIAIRKMRKSGKRFIEIAQLYNVSIGAIFNVTARRSWRHI